MLSTSPNISRFFLTFADLFFTLASFLTVASALAVEPTASPAPSPAEPFAFADFTWLNGNSRQHSSALDSKYFTGEFSLDANYVFDFSHPKDHTLAGSNNAGRTGEIQLQHLGIGGDFHYNNVRGRLFTQFGMYSTMTPRTDPSTSRGQWDMADAYRYIAEASGGYHFDVWNGINLDVGIFMSYVGVESYYNFENWIYQMSYVSANTPWYFNGVRVQTFPNDRVKIEYWLVNGWQSYGMFNEAPGLGASVLWRPSGGLSLVTNWYYGHDTLGIPNRMRLHSDSTFQMKYYDHADTFLDKSAFSFTFDIGCESGDGVKCAGSPDSTHQVQNFIGAMAYNRFWFSKDVFALTVGGGMITNPGRYLVLLPPVNGATASSGSPYFTTNSGDSFRAWDSSLTLNYMPNENITYVLEFIHRHANVPYFAGNGGVTPPEGNTGNPKASIPGWAPDLTQNDDRFNLAMMVRF